MYLIVNYLIDRSTAIKAVMKKKNQLRQQANEPECKHGADLWHYDKGEHHL